MSRDLKTPVLSSLASSGDFVRQFDVGAPDPSSVIPDGETQAEVLAEQKRREDVEWEAQKRLNPKIIGQVYDDWHDAQTVQHQAAPSNLPTAEERDAEERARVQLAQAIMAGVYERLAPCDLSPVACVPDGTGGGFLLSVKDQVGRRYRVEMDFDALGGIMAAACSDPFQRLLDHICQAVLDKRADYFARMQ